MTKTTLSVEGMTCASCIEQVTEALAIDGVGHVEVNLDTGKVQVEHDAQVSQGRLIAALQQVGYDAMPDASAGESRVARKATCCGSSRR
jgi:Cu+-exporting ATPase